MIKLWKWFKENSKWVLNNKGTWAGIGVGVAAIGVGASLSGGKGGGGGELKTFMPKVDWLEPPAAKFREAPKPEQYPEFPEGEEARNVWFDKLMQWAEEPGYGAIAPNWGDIWEQAQGRVNQYYWGGPGGQPGLAGKVRASAARRNVSQSPALETELTKMGLQEGADIKNLAVTQATQEAQFGEQGRQNWLQSLQGLTGLRPQYYQPAGMWQQPYANVEQAYGGGGGGGQPGIGQLIGDLGSAGGNLAMQYQQQNWLNDLLGSSTNTGSYGGGYDTSPYDYSLSTSPYYPA